MHSFSKYPVVMTSFHELYMINTNILFKVIPSYQIVAGVIHSTNKTSNSLVVQFKKSRTYIEYVLHSYFWKGRDQHTKILEDRLLPSTPLMPMMNMWFQCVFPVRIKINSALEFVNKQIITYSKDIWKIIDDAIDLLVYGPNKVACKWAKKGLNNGCRQNQLFDTQQREVEVYCKYCVKDKGSKAQCKIMIDKNKKISNFINANTENVIILLAFIGKTQVLITKQKILVDLSLPVGRSTVKL